MNVCVLQPTADFGDRWCHVIAPADGTGATLGGGMRGNILASDFAFDATSGPAGDLIFAWSGTMADDLYTSDPRTWLSPGQQALRDWCAATRPALEAAGRAVCFTPFSRHVLSDPQSTLTFDREMEDAPFHVTLAPACFLEPSMLDEVDDHLARAFESLGDRARAVLLTDAAPADDGAALSLRPLGSGVLPVDHMLDLLARCVPDSTPVILLPDQLDEQLARLDAAGVRPAR